MSEKLKRAWHAPIDRALPCWDDYLAALDKLCVSNEHPERLPSARALQSLVTSAITNSQGKAIRFVSPEQTSCDYEEEIFQTGRVSTRSNNWHDIFNALVWCRFPALKAAMNEIHVQEIQRQASTVRGRRRDALTVFDECGVIVASSDESLLHELSSRRWTKVFRNMGSAWKQSVNVFICGHALLEKYLDPYKAITAHALLVHCDACLLESHRDEVLGHLDQEVSQAMLNHQLLRTTTELSPLPLSGIPGWGLDNRQDDQFYADTNVFRLPKNSFTPAPIVKLPL